MIKLESCVLIYRDHYIPDTTLLNEHKWHQLVTTSDVLSVLRDGRKLIEKATEEQYPETRIGTDIS